MSYQNTNLTRFYSDGSIPNSYRNLNNTLNGINLNESYAERKLMEALNQLVKNENNYGSTNDMRFQQKQQQEREQRRIEMTTTTKISMDETQSLSSSLGRGKVRQMFEQRRGVDKSYPLKPISNTTTTTTVTKRSTSGGAPTSTTTKKQISSTNSRNSLNNNRLASTVTNIAFDKTATKNRSVSNGNNNNSNITNGNGSNSTISKKTSINNNKANSLDNKNDLFGEENNDNLDDDTDVMGSKVSPKLPNLGKLTLEGEVDNNDYNILNDETMKKNNSDIKLKPVITRKIPNAALINQGGIGDGKHIKSPRDSTVKPNIAAASPKNTVPSSEKSVNKAEPNVLRSTAPPPGMVTCKICSRNFNEDRIGKHQEICQKSMSKKRKTFDAAVHRVKGTDAEKYVKRPSPKTRTGPSKTVSKTPALSLPEQGNAKKSNWRKKHEEFIQAIRAAKQVQEHLAKGGKLSDLPPPPPSENSDYVQCPHCNRRFNEAAASRHIPKCATMLHNKPKPNAPPKRRY